MVKKFANSSVRYKIRLHGLSTPPGSLRMNLLRQITGGIEKRTESIRLDRTVIEKIENLRKQTPEPQSVIISGKLDMIEHSTEL